MINKLIRLGFSSSLRVIPSYILQYHYQLIKDSRPQVTISSLKCGPTLLTEQSGFPSYSDIGICFRAGFRDERPTERGSIKNFLKDLYQTSKDDCLDNFESVLRSGSMLDSNVDQELTYFKCSFLEEDLEQQLDTLLKLVLTTKHLQERPLVSQEEEIPFDELIVNAAYPGQLMSNRASDIYNFSEDEFVQFQRELFTPKNMVIGYAGVLPHDQIKAMIESRLDMFPEFLQDRQLRATEKSIFIPNTLKQENESEEINIAVVFQGLPWSSPDMANLQVMNSIMGNASSWSSGGPGKGMRARATTNLMNRIQSIESANGINIHYTDSGLWGLKVSGHYQEKNDLLNALISELQALVQPMTDEEFRRGQNILNSQIQLNLERQADRLEEQVKNMFTFNRLACTQYHETILQVNKLFAQQYISNLINNTMPVVVYQGRGANTLPSNQQVSSQLKK